MVESSNYSEAYGQLTGIQRLQVRGCFSEAVRLGVGASLAGGIVGLFVSHEAVHEDVDGHGIHEHEHVRDEVGEDHHEEHGAHEAVQLLADVPLDENVAQL